MAIILNPQLCPQLAINPPPKMGARRLQYLGLRIQHFDKVLSSQIESGSIVRAVPGQPQQELPPQLFKNEAIGLDTNLKNYCSSYGMDLGMSRGAERESPLQPKFL